MTVRASLKALIVDDNLMAIGHLLRGMREVGVNIEPVIVHPKEFHEDFTTQLPDPATLDDVDIAFVDIELGEDFIEVHGLISPLSVQGGSQVLPWLREHCPWIPVFAWSRLIRYQQSKEGLRAIAASFPFDAFLPKPLLCEDNVGRSHPDWNMPFWNWLYRSAVNNRLFAQLRNNWRNPLFPDASIAIDCSPILRTALDDAYGNNSWTTLLTRFFSGFSNRCTVTPLSSGFSGASVVKVRCEPIDLRAAYTEWVVKLSRSPSKLQREVVAHGNLLLEGRYISHVVPLRCDSVLAVGGVGAIAYAFSAGSPASDCINKTDANLLAEVISLLYAGKTIVPCEDFNGVMPIVGDFNELTSIAYSSGSPLPGLISSLLEEGVHSVIGRTLEFSESLVHGDLHLDNILLGKGRLILIDWARKRYAPVAYDRAKILTDSFRRNVYTLPSTPLDGSGWPWFNPVHVAFASTDDDLVLCRIYSVLLYTKLLSFSDVPSDVKDRIIHGLQVRTSGDDWHLRSDPT
ncbi:MAG: phosphotransferase [Pseudomonadota bacterium]